MVIQLDAIASNLENRGTGKPVGLPVGCSSCQLLYQREVVDRLVDRMVVRLDAVTANYCTTGKRSTSWPKWSTGWDKRSTSLVNNVLRDFLGAGSRLGLCNDLRSIS